MDINLCVLLRKYFMQNKAFFGVTNAPTCEHTNVPGVLEKAARDIPAELLRNVPSAISPNVLLIQTVEK